MLIVLLVICIGIFVSGFLVYFLADCGEDNPLTYVCSVFGGIAMLVCIGVVIAGLVHISQDRVIGQKIEMYQEENVNIETNITNAVEKYLEHEFDIYDSLQGENIEVLLVAYPQIKSDALVEKQLEIFVSNNDKIRKLKEEKLDIKVWCWWVYFG